jgi:hypothetical protein
MVFVGDLVLDQEPQGQLQFLQAVQEPLRFAQGQQVRVEDENDAAFPALENAVQRDVVRMQRLEPLQDVVVLLPVIEDDLPAVCPGFGGTADLLDGVALLQDLPADGREALDPGDGDLGKGQKAQGQAVGGVSKRM